MNAFPDKFDIYKNKLEWGWLENRPFLRAYESKALFLLEKNKEEALRYFKQLLIWNPNDNQGIREIVSDIYVIEGRWEDTIALAKKYPSNVNPSVGLGEALAYYKKGDVVTATKKLKSCIKYLPLCAKILLKEKPKKPKTEIPGYITVGGEDQAYEFWQSQGKAKAWRQKDTKEWLKENID